MMKVLNTVTGWLTPPCEDIAYLISKSMDTKLTFHERWQVRIHILGCILCRRYQDQLRKMEKTLKRAANLFSDQEAEGHETLSPEAYQRIQDALHRHPSH